MPEYVYVIPRDGQLPFFLADPDYAQKREPRFKGTRAVGPRTSIVRGNLVNEHGDVMYAGFQFERKTARKICRAVKSEEHNVLVPVR